MKCLKIFNPAFGVQAYCISDCLHKQHAGLQNISISIRCANDIARTRLLTLFPLAKVWIGISLTCDTHVHYRCSVPTEVICVLSFLRCHLTPIDFFSYFPSSALHLLPPKVPLPLWPQACSPPPTFVSQFSSEFSSSLSTDSFSFCFLFSVLASFELN